MKIPGLLLIAALLPVAAPAVPVDTYFAVAVTENSHNHGGENLMSLDFQEALDTGARRNARTVLSPRVADDRIELDADLGEWDPAQFTTIDSRVMNNYPLSTFYDVVPVQIHIASAWDDRHLYFALRFQDANGDASVNRNRWIHDDDGWHRQPHEPPRPGAPTSRAVNAGDSLAGHEDEDRVLFMFPIVDRQQNFRDGGHGCAGFCHPNLVESRAPTEAAIGGDEVAGMHTALPGDSADIWHWTATRSAPAHTLKDAHLVFGEGVFDGRRADPGRSPDIDNDRSELQLGQAKAGQGPAYLSRHEYAAGEYRKLGHTTRRLTEADLLRIEPSMAIALGASVPYTVNRSASGSRADVEVASRFDAASQAWILEIRRALDTGDAEHDHDFTTGTPALPPTSAPPVPGDPARGEKLFQEKQCRVCHGDNGEGVYEDGHWTAPRIQRASGPLIRKTADPNRPKRQRALAYLRDAGTPPPRALMPYIPLTEQEAEHIAAWLQTRFTPAGR